MTAARYGGEDLDFRLTFGEDSQPTASGHTDVGADNDSSCYVFTALQQQHPELSASQSLHSQDTFSNSYVASSSASNPVDSPSRVFDCPSIQITSIPTTCQQDLGAQQHGRHLEHDGASGPLTSRDQLYLPLDPSYRDTSTLCPSPCSSLSSRSWLSDASSCESFSHVYDDVEAELTEAAADFRFTSPLVSPQSSPLPSPLASPQASPQVSPMVSPFGSPSCAYAEDPWSRYQQQQRPYSYSLSPHHSPYQSPRTSVNEETWLSARPHSSSSKPSSRPTSPYGKRPYSSADGIPGSSSPHLSPTLSPSHSPRGSVTDETWLGSPALMASSFQTSGPDLDIPSKTRRTFQGNQSQDCMALLPGHSALEENNLMSASLDSNVEVSLSTLKKEDIVEHYLSVPTQFNWAKPKQTNTPLFRSTSLPSLDFSLPSQYSQYELKLEVQPRPHHRAHYETEGSRGAIKSPCGRHPVVKLFGYSEKPVSLQMFIGTADDRHVRPHPFYQVHRITGKTVTTPSQDMVVNNTKILEIPLLPENNMSASIDCAGILKLRNSDIELRKGETDIGRKNTRVRAVFRVHIPQANGKVLSLQVSSVSIECSQRSAQELPHIETFNPTCDSVMGGKELVIIGSNLNPGSKVIFLEKSHDGRTQWEVDAKMVHEKSNESSIVVKIPPYHKRVLGSSVQVQFYVSNGKRKRSLIHRFTYVPVQVKQEYEDATPADEAEQFNPLEQWLYSAGPVCVPPSNQLSHSHMGSPHLNRHHPPDGSLSSASGFHQMLHPLSLDFTSSYQGPQQNLPYHNGQLILSCDTSSVQEGKLSPLLSENLSAEVGVGYRNTSGAVHGLNQASAQRQNGGYLSPTPGTLCNPNSLNDYQSAHGSGELVVYPKSKLDSPASAPSSLHFNREALVKLKSNATLSPAGTSGSGASSNHSIDRQSVNIKQEPEKEKTLTFQSIGLQDITLDDVSEIIVRDLFQGPDSAPDGCS